MKAQLRSPGIESQFDPYEREAQLRAEAESWDTSAPRPASPSDIPTIDLGDYFGSGQPDALETAADQLRAASERVGFYILVGHGLPAALVGETLATAQAFFAQPEVVKQRLLMDRPDWPLGGVGYLPVGARKLPQRSQGNTNEAFIMKTGGGVTRDQNQWLGHDSVPGMRTVVERYADALEDLALRLIPVYEAALDLVPGFLAPAFTAPFSRLRLTRYPALAAADADRFSIAPHVDSTFFTILAQQSAGLTIYSEAEDTWLDVPHAEGALIVNTGELLRQWSNDRFVSVKHFVRNHGDESRYSIPFFFNANADFVLECLPTCQGPDNPPRYPPLSYLQSQAVAQGE